MKRAEVPKREELFKGAPPAEQAPPHVTRGQAAYETYRNRQHMSNHELLQEAQNMHEDTTHTLQNGLKVVEDARRIQEATNQALHDQSRQIAKTQDNMHKMKQDIQYSEKLLAFMRRCCLCACCGDPEHRKEKDWLDRAHKQHRVEAKEAKAAPYPPPAPGSKTAQKAAAPVAQKYRDAAAPSISTQGLQESGYGAEAAAIDANTREQDRHMDQISEGLDALYKGALAQRETLVQQKPVLDGMLGQAEELGIRVKDMNKNSQLRKFK